MDSCNLQSPSSGTLTMRCPWSSTRSPLVKLLMSGWCVQARPVTVFHDNAWWFQVLNSVYTIIHPPTQTTTTTVILVEMKWLCITAGASREHDALFFIVVDRCRGLRHLYIYICIDCPCWIILMRYLSMDEKSVVVTRNVQESSPKLATKCTWI